MMDESQWERVGDLFDRMLEGGDPGSTLESEPDSGIREAARKLWHHHIRADQEKYLDAPIEFDIAPIFRPGQRLLNRFRIEKLLGSGGMGEVYLAFDERVEDRVALKTIARLLAPSPAIRKRFAAEVQSARRVTHPNVCRIHELFEDGETVFFSMEYVEGEALSEKLEGPWPRKHARSFLLQMAQALHAAHQTGVVHGDFKPANVMVTPVAAGVPRAVIMDFGLARALDRAPSSDPALSVRAGTVDYMAPELHGGAAPTIRSDIFAFGKVAAQLLPNESIWKECTHPLPALRLDTLDRVIRKLAPATSRRYWLGGLAIASAGLAAEALRLLGSSEAEGRMSVNLTGKTPTGLPEGSRILVNGFHATAIEASGVRLFRSVLLTGIQQSPRVRPIADQDFLPALRHLAPSANLPLTGKLLSDILTQFRAAFWVDGDLRQSGGRYSADVRVLSTAGRDPLAYSSFHDASSVIALAQSAAAWLRKSAGESTRSLEVYSADVAKYTSSVPEALQKYFDALEFYALGEMTSALPLLTDAIRLDPEFAQAHHMLGLVWNATRRYEEGTRSIETAFKLAAVRNLPEAERVPIETNYYRVTEDPRMDEAARRAVRLQPDEPRVYIVLGQTLTLAGHAKEGAAELQKAARLAPTDWMPVLGLEDALVEAGQFSAALDEFQAAQARGVTHKWIYNGAGAAYLCLERYAEAAAAFANEPLDASNTADVQGPNIMQGKLDVAIAAMQEQQGRARNPIEAHQANQYLCGLYFATGRLDLARRHVREMANLSAEPRMARRLSGTVSWARRLSDDETFDKARSTLKTIADRFPENTLLAVLDRHADGLDAWRHNALDVAESGLLASLGKAFNIWTLFDVAELLTRRGKWAPAEAHWKEFESRRGTVVVKVWCPVVIVLGWLYRAVAAQGANDRATAHRYASKVLDHWSSANPKVQIVQDARTIAAVTKPL